MTPEDTSRMAEKTDRQAQIDPWKDIDDREEYIGGTWYLTRDYVDAARSADAALLRERDAQIAELTKAVQGNALAVVKANDAASQQIASLTAQVEQQTQGYTLKGLSNYFGWGLESDRDVWQFAASREHTLRLAQELLETSRSDAGTAADAIRDRIDTLRAERDAAQQERDRLKEQMQFFADAKPETWDDPADFRLWVQSRARYLLAPFASQEPGGHQP